MKRIEDYLDVVMDLVNYPNGRVAFEAVASGSEYFDDLSKIVNAVSLPRQRGPKQSYLTHVMKYWHVDESGEFIESDKPIPFTDDNGPVIVFYIGKDVVANFQVNKYFCKCDLDGMPLSHMREYLRICKEYMPQ